VYTKGEASMKTERVTFLAAPEFKAFLAAEAERDGVSVGELVRRRCEQRPSSDEAALAQLAAALRASVASARKSLAEGLDEAHAVLNELAVKRNAPAGPAASPAARRARKTASARA
jgi:hypothetical protein